MKWSSQDMKGSKKQQDFRYIINIYGAEEFFMNIKLQSAINSFFADAPFFYIRGVKKT